jgi:ribosomal protein L29
MALARVRAPETIISDLFADLEDLRHRTFDLLARAEQSGNAPAMVALIREARANVAAIATLINSVKTGPVREAEPTDSLSDEELEHAIMELYQRQMRFAGEEIEEAEGMPVQSIADWGTP